MLSSNRTLKRLYSVNLQFRMNAFLSFTCIDPSLGKIDKHSLSQQTLMELLIEGFTQSKDRICGSTENPKNVSEWKNVLLSDDREVVRIRWYWQLLEGSLALQWLPLSVQEAYFSSNNLSGTVDLTSLPDCIEFLSLADNRFKGTIDLTKLPLGLKTLYLSSNKFKGKTDFSQLPKALESIDVSNTQLEGEVFDFNGNFGCGMSYVMDVRVE